MKFKNYVNSLSLLKIVHSNRVTSDCFPTDSCHLNFAENQTMNIYEVEPGEDEDGEEIPNCVEEFVSAKAFLQKSSSETGENL